MVLLPFHFKLPHGFSCVRSCLMRCAFVPTVFLVLFTETTRKSYCVRAKLKCVHAKFFGPCPCSVSSVFLFHVIRIYFDCRFFSWKSSADTTPLRLCQSSTEIFGWAYIFGVMSGGPTTSSCRSLVTEFTDATNDVAADGISEHRLTPV